MAPAARLRCPHCGGALTEAGRALRCPRGHAYDVARDGHVTLLPPRGKPPAGDSAGMVAARVAFLDAGHYAPIVRAVCAAAQELARPGATVADIGAGTGHYLAAVLDALPDARGVALDASRSALRRAVRAHPRVTGVACDIWRELPLQDATADLVVCVFAPRNGPEIARVLAPAGALVVVTPAQHHLRELVEELGLVRVDADKPARLHATLAPHLRAVERRRVEFEMALDHDDVHALVSMGPTARHLTGDDIRRRAAALPVPLQVTAAVDVGTFRAASRS